MVVMGQLMDQEVCVTLGSRTRFLAFAYVPRMLEWVCPGLRSAPPRELQGYIQ